MFDRYAMFALVPEMQEGLLTESTARAEHVRVA